MPFQIKKYLLYLILPIPYECIHLVYLFYPVFYSTEIDRVLYLDSLKNQLELELKKRWVNFERSNDFMTVILPIGVRSLVFQFIMVFLALSKALV